MPKEIATTSKLNSYAEELFVELFCEIFGPENSQHLYIQHPFVDIYGGNRFIDFALIHEGEKVAIEIDGETYHNPNRISRNKYYDDLLKQNSLVNSDWKVYRWVYSQLNEHPERVKDEMLTFFGEFPVFKGIEDYLPKQRGKIIELKDHQESAISNLRKMRDKGDSIALLYHATGERVIIVMGAVCVIKSRVSGTLNKYISCIA